MTRTRIQYLITAVMVMAFAACAGKPEVGIERDIVYDKPMPLIEHEYELGPGDTLEIVYHFTPKPDTKDYIISVADILKVEFAYHQDLNRELTVTPDGEITMPRKGGVKALGLTASQLEKNIEKVYSKEFIDPVVTVTMVQYNRTIDRLKTAIQTSARGQSKLTTVRPDGYVSFPVIDDVLAAGKTMPEIKKTVSRQYKEQIDNLTITLILKVMKANVAYIFGEVDRPNTYLMQKNLTVSQLISTAGGFKNTAERSSILVISRDKQRRPVGRLVNIENVLYHADLSQDLELNQYDIVFVPKSRIARANLWIDQHIQRMIPSNLLEPYNIGGTLINKTLIK